MKRRDLLTAAAAVLVTPFMGGKALQDEEETEFIGYVWFRERGHVPIVDTYGLTYYHHFPQTKWCGVGRTPTYYPASEPEQPHLRLECPKGMNVQPGRRVVCRKVDGEWKIEAMLEES
jgi:hypothetical protein